ncbi:Protein diaphanous 2, partial [Bulinus truncatus]
MDKKKESNRQSFLGLKIKSKKPSKSTSSSSTKSQPPEDYGFNGGTSQSEGLDFQHMGEKEVNQYFEQWLDDMNLTEEKKAPLRSKDEATKKQMLQMQFRGSAKTVTGFVFVTQTITGFVFVTQTVTGFVFVTQTVTGFVFVTQTVTGFFFVTQTVT